MSFISMPAIMGASAAGGSAFDFGTLGNLILELDATDSPKSYSSGSLVSQWDDLSGNNNHATASAGDEADDATRTIGGKTALEFDGAATKYHVSGIATPAAGTIAMVLVFDDVGGANYWPVGSGAQSSTAGGFGGFNLTTGKWRSGISDGTNRALKDSAPSPTLSNGVAAVVLSAWDSGNLLSRVNNGEESTTHSLGSLGADTMWVGTTDGLGGTHIHDGAIAHVVMYDELLSAANRATLVSELASIYGISL